MNKPESINTSFKKDKIPDWEARIDICLIFFWNLEENDISNLAKPILGQIRTIGISLVNFDYNNLKIENEDQAVKIIKYLQLIKDKNIILFEKEED